MNAIELGEARPTDLESEVVWCAERAWTEGALRLRTARFASVLADAGLVPGERVVILLPNSVGLLTSYYAVLRAGGVAVLVHAGAPAPVVAAIVKDCAPAVIVTTAALARGIEVDVRVRLVVADGEASD